MIELFAYRIMVSEALGLLKAGKTDEEAYIVLWQRYLAEFEPGYNEEEAFVHKGLVIPKQVRVQQGHKIDKKPKRENRVRVKHRSVYSNDCLDKMYLPGNIDTGATVLVPQAKDG